MKNSSLGQRFPAQVHPAKSGVRRIWPVRVNFGFSCLGVLPRAIPDLEEHSDSVGSPTTRCPGLPFRELVISKQSARACEFSPNLPAGEIACLAALDSIPITPSDHGLKGLG
jgi:hypothetical protein